MPHLGDALDVSWLYPKLNRSKLRKENYSVKGIKTSDLLFEHLRKIWNTYDSANGE